MIVKFCQAAAALELFVGLLASFVRLFILGDEIYRRASEVRQDSFIAVIMWVVLLIYFQRGDRK